jgi:hypothetical protein
MAAENAAKPRQPPTIALGPANPKNDQRIKKFWLFRLELEGIKIPWAASAAPVKHPADTPFQISFFARYCFMNQ